MGLFDLKNTLGRVAKGVSNTVTNILEYEMSYDIYPTDHDSYSGYYESFHNYLDTHLNEWSNNKYNIFEIMAIHDALDEIQKECWNPNYSYKETKVDLRLPEDFGNEYDITIGYLHYLRMMALVTKPQEEYDLKEIDDIIKGVLCFNENSFYMMDGATKEAMISLIEKIPQISEKYLGRSIVPDLPEKINEYPETIRYQAQFTQQGSWGTERSNYNTGSYGDYGSGRDDYYRQQADEDERRRCEQQEMERLERQRQEEEYARRQEQQRQEEAIRNQAYWDAQDGRAAQSTNSSYLSYYDDYKNNGY